MVLGIAFRDLKNLRVFPSVGMKRHAGATIKVNFGQTPFIFDIDGLVAVSVLENPSFESGSLMRS